MILQRITLSEDPFYEPHSDRNFTNLGLWPATWISHPQLPALPVAVAYRKQFSLDAATTIRAHVSADERYELFIDGERVAMGSERGDAGNWFFETYDLSFEAGQHTIVALVSSVGEERAYAQMTIRHGWLFVPQSEEHRALLGTGTATWDAKIIDGLSWTSPMSAWGTGLNQNIDGNAYPWDIEKGAGEGWTYATSSGKAIDGVRFNEFEALHRLLPAQLPPMIDELRTVGTVRLVAAIDDMETTYSIPVRAADNIAAEVADWQTLVRGGSFTVPAHTRRRVLIDLDDYYCARPDITVSGGAGATLSILWQEALYDDNGKATKGNRDEIEGKVFKDAWNDSAGVGNSFTFVGGAARTYSTFWWQAGRYLEILVETAAEAVTIDRFALRETRYPLEMETRFECDDPRLASITPIMVRVMQMCAHETYMDCPYYEQMMYIGDTRLEVLTTWAMTADDRLPQKASRVFDMSRQLNGLTQSRYPVRVRQIIPPFSLWHCHMVHDRALWKNTPEFDRTLMPGVRGVLDYFLSCRNENGLIEAPQGWNFLDWPAEWPMGVPKEGDEGVLGNINWHTVFTLLRVAELEEWNAEPEMAARWRRAAKDLTAATEATFWDEARGLYAEDRAHTEYTEHTQCLAILSGALNEERENRLIAELLAAPDLIRTTIMFRFYLMEAFYKLRRSADFWALLPLWFQHPELGFKTTWEQSDPNTTRSDCHAWGAHPLFHYFATILGIRPTAPGFKQVHIAPLLGELQHAAGELPHPDGTIAVSYVRSNSTVLRAQVTLPADVNGTFEWNGAIHPLHGGAQTFEL